MVIGCLLFVIGHWSLVNGDKLKSRAFCQLPYMAERALKKPYIWKCQGIRKMVIPLPHLPILTRVGILHSGWDKTRWTR
ncbi:MAG: hypothetical protein F6K31_01320 [Symploca sp. SIO2G7]|nr:hypothetical protein [Symploca sp. SIO2G7]